MQCTAKSKRSGERCRAKAVKGHRTCRMHAGRAAVGPAASQWKHGRYSKHMPTGLLEAFRERVNDPALLELESEIALLQTRLGALLERVYRDNGDIGTLWGQLGARWAQLKQAQLAGDAERASVLFGQVDATITAGAGDSATWREIGETIERIRRVVDTETRRTQLATQLDKEYVSREVAGAAFFEVGVLLRENWPVGADRAGLARIADGLARFLHEPPIED